MPTSGEEPGSELRPCAWAASASSTESTPASTRAVPAPASTSTPRIRSVLIRIASSSEPRATAPWPVPWPETRSPFSAAKRTTAATSSPLSTKATALGLLVGGEVPAHPRLVPVGVGRGRDHGRRSPAR